VFPVGPQPFSATGVENVFPVGPQPFSADLSREICFLLVLSPSQPIRAVTCVSCWSSAVLSRLKQRKCFLLVLSRSQRNIPKHFRHWKYGSKSVVIGDVTKQSRLHYGPFAVQILSSHHKSCISQFRSRIYNIKFISFSFLDPRHRQLYCSDVNRNQKRRSVCV
jgi:hypothetical protein